jgi:sterol 3beta-glucosyltransferase
MNIVLMALGTRGDVQPMIALGKALKEQGHHVRVIAGENFAAWLESHGLELFPTVDMETVMRSELGLKWVETPNQFEQLRVMKEMTLSVKDRSVSEIIKGTQDADLLIGGFVSEPYLQTIHEKRGVPLVTAALQPYRATVSGRATMMPITQGNSPLNRMFGKFAERIMWSVAEVTANELRTRLQLPTLKAGSYLPRMRQIPVMLAISEHVVPNAPDTNSVTTGYWFLDEPFSPPDDLIRFLEAGEPPVYVGFGSIPSSKPDDLLRTIRDALMSAGQRGIVAAGWNESWNNTSIELPPTIKVIKSVPHGWLFPRVSAVVHHGGAGTTAAGLHAGKPTFIIPRIADQPFWGRTVHQLGVGIKPLPQNKFTAESFAEGVHKLTSDSTIRRNAESLAARIRAENGVEHAIQWLTESKYLR